MRSRIDVVTMLSVFAISLFATVPSTPALAQAVIGWTDQQLAKRVSQYAKLTPEHFRDTATIKDDDLETVATIDTARGFIFKGGFTDRVRSDIFLRALIDKRSGKTIWQLYAHVTYGDAWRRFESATYSTDAGPQSVPTVMIARNVDCQYGCVYSEDVAFEIPESVLRELAQTASVRPVRPWRFRLKAKSGEDWTDDMAPAELAGLLMAVERFRGSHK